MNELELIIGQHSIVEALKNNQRSQKTLVTTDESLAKFKSFIDESVTVELKSSHVVQELAKQECNDLKLTYARVPSNCFLKATALERKETNEFLNFIDSGDKKIVCLDQVTDTHNAAAIFRTASFYGVDAIVIAQKGNFRMTPSFYRIASGATEYVQLFQVPSLAKLITKIQDREIPCVGFSEHAEKETINSELKEKSLCLVLGAEETGLSNAVMRKLDELICLKPAGHTQSLNVSVAAAIAMERCF